MQPQHCKFCVESDEYETEQQCLAQQIKCMVVLRNYHFLVFRAVRNCAHILETHSMQYVRFALLTLFTLRCTCMARQSQKHVPSLLTSPHVLVQRSLRCTRKAYCGYVHLVVQTPCNVWNASFIFVFLIDVLIGFSEQFSDQFSEQFSGQFSERTIDIHADVTHVQLHIIYKTETE